MYRIHNIYNTLLLILAYNTHMLTNFLLEEKHQNCIFIVLYSAFPTFFIPWHFTENYICKDTLE